MLVPTAPFAPGSRPGSAPMPMPVSIKLSSIPRKGLAYASLSDIWRQNSWSSGAVVCFKNAHQSVVDSKVPDLSTIDLVLNSGSGGRESWRRNLRAPGPLFNTTPTVP